jgi:hypothetical protein
MDGSLVLKGHVDDQGTVFVDEKAPLPPCQVRVVVEPVAASSPEREAVETPADNQTRQAKLRNWVEQIRAVKCQPPPDDGLGAKDYKRILYGPKDG